MFYDVLMVRILIKVTKKINMLYRNNTIKTELKDDLRP